MEKFIVEVNKSTPYCSVECPRFEITDDDYYYIFNKPIHHFGCKNERVCEYMYLKMKDEGKHDET